MGNRQKKSKVEIKKLKVFGVATFFTFAFFLSTVSAQESVNATGGSASGSGGSASYSVGQVVYQSHIGTNGSVVEGVQQPYEISVVTAIEEAIGINLSISTYPNPTSDYLTLEVNATATLSFQSLVYQLFDMQGKLIETKKLEGPQTSIVMSNLAPAAYFLKVVQNNKEVKTFKIVKQ